MLTCEHCDSKETKVKGFYFKCKRCGMILCVRCRIPETHDCVCVKYTYGENWTKHELLDYTMDTEAIKAGKRRKQRNKAARADVKTVQGNRLTSD